jgi:ligand-binding sensor domain-containing protein
MQTQGIVIVSTADEITSKNRVCTRILIRGMLTVAVMLLVFSAIWWALAQSELPALAQETGWSTPVMISTNTRMSWFSDVAVDSWGQPHVVWNSGRSVGQDVVDLLMYSTLADGEWLVPNDIAVTAYGGYTVRPAISVDSAGTLHVTFRGNTTIYYTNAPVSEAWNASAWLPRRRISGADSDSAYYSDVAVDEHGGIHVVWNEGVSSGLGERWLWFGTRNGAAAYDGTRYRSQESQAALDGRAVYDMIEDEAGAQWFGTDEGVYRFDGTTWQTFTVGVGEASQKVNCVIQDLDGGLWFGTDTGIGRYYKENQEDIWATYTSESGLPGNVVHATAVDSSGVVWFGTGGGLASYDGRDWVSYTLKAGLVTTEVLAVAVDSQENVWVGTGQGVSRYDGKRWVTYTVGSGLLSNVVTAIDVDREGSIWFGTDGGLSQFDGQEWTSYTTAEGLSEGAVTALMVDNEGVVWVGTEAGVSRYAERVWETFELPREFANQTVTVIGEDRYVNAMCPFCADIFYRHSTNGGRSWSVPINLSGTFAGSVKPQVHVGSGNSVYVTWEEGEDWYVSGGYPVASMYVHSSDSGNTWAEPTVFSSQPGAPQQITLGVRDSDLVVVWRLPEEVPAFYHYQLSTDGGVTWSSPEPIPGVIAKPWESFSLDAYHATTDSAGNVHLLVLGYLLSGDKDLGLAIDEYLDLIKDQNLGLIHLLWNGSEWSAPVRIYASNDPPEWPRIDVGAGNQVYATWFTRDEKHINESERGRYKVWTSFYQANAPSDTPLSPPKPIPTVASDVLEQATPAPVLTPTPLIALDGSGLPPGLDTESDEIGRLLVALSPIAAILLVIVALRIGRSRRRR